MLTKQEYKNFYTFTAFPLDYDGIVICFLIFLRVIKLYIIQIGTFVLHKYHTLTFVVRSETLQFYEIHGLIDIFL